MRAGLQSVKSCAKIDCRRMAIWITGIGAVSAAGKGVDALWEAALLGKTHASPREFDFGTEVSTRPVARIPVGGLILPEFTGAPRLDRAAQLALTAGSGAWHSAGLDRQPPAPRRTAVFVGTSRGPVQKWEEARARMDAGKRQLPSLAATGTLASLSGALAHHLAATGPCLTVSATCASAAGAIALGAQHLLSGAADVAVVGGAEAPLSPVVVGLMAAASLLGSHPDDPQQTCRPFDRSRNGLVVGEGAGILILERSADAKARGARGYAKLSGYATGLSHSGKTGVDESGEGLAGVIASSLEMAKIEPADLDYLNAHGTGTLLNDLAEAKAICGALGKDTPPVSSTKPVTGHCLGATPALEAILCIKALDASRIPPTPNFRQPDPAIELDIVAGDPRPAYLQHIASTSRGFWGNHASLVFSQI